MPGSSKRSVFDAITDPALYRDLVSIFSEAVALSPDDQDLYLEERCKGRADLLQMAQGLLRADREGGFPLAEGERKPAGDLPASEGLVGRTLSEYQITAQIGQGGMASIYRAVDTRLGRTVALKVLPPALLRDETSRERFLREARTLASIDHPNVCTIYEMRELDELVFIAMAFLEGPTLEHKLENGPLPLIEAVDIAIQTARGLAAAHAKGIVHRDIKPSNLMLTGSGPLGTQVRVLDFGIARLSQGTALTEKGLTLGTVCYMAPEQVTGVEVDARTDVWSLGIVLHQMLVGRVPFGSDSLQETLAAIAGPKAVDLRQVGRTLPPKLRSILSKAVEKDPGKRHQTALEFAAELEAFRNQITTGSVAVDGRKHGRAWIAALLAAALCCGLAVTFITRRKEAAGDLPRIVPFTFEPGYQEYPAISPDGKTVAYAGQGKQGARPLEIYLQLIDSSEALRVTDAPPGLEDRFPTWNDSGSRIAFLRGRVDERFGRVLTVSSLGGTPTDLGLEGALRLGKLSWNASGNALAYTALDPANHEPAIFEVSLPDHSLRQLSFPVPGQTDCCPQYSPDGDRLAFIRNGVDVVIAGSHGRPERRLPVQVSYPELAWTPDGNSIVYSWFGELARINLATGTVSHTREALFGSGIRDIAIRGTHMVFVRADVRHSIWKLNLDGLRSHRSDDAQRSELTASAKTEDSPQFSPDGQWIVFASDRLGLNDNWIGAADGTKLRRLTFFDEQSAGTPRWSSDGKSILFDMRKQSRKPDIWIIPAAGGLARVLPTTAGGGDVPAWSADGRWIYYHSPLNDQIWKEPSRGGPSIQVTRHGGFEAFESADGSTLYYSKSEANSGLWRLDLKTGRESPIPELAQTGDYRDWALAPRGIYFVPNTEAWSPQAAVRFFDFATAKISRLAVLGRLDTQGPGALAVSRDEKYLLYVHVDRDNRNIMLVSNYLP